MQCSNIHGLEKIDNLLNMKILKEKNDEQFTEHQKNGQNKTIDDTVSPTDMSHVKINDSPRLPSPKEILPAATTLTITPISKENYDQLFAQCQHFAKVFKDDSTEKGQRLHAAFIAWQDFILTADKLTTTIEKFAHKYDLDENTPGNGYRSFINVTDSCIAYGQEICKRLHIAHHTLFFRKKLFMKEVEACSQLLSSLCSCLHYLLILNEWSRDSGDLFSEGKHTAEELFELGDTINQYCFYGRCLGFQYSDSIRGVLRFISISMASFSETFYSHESDGAVLKTTRSVWTSGKYLLNPELRARRIVNISQNANIEFCKSFWFLAESELMHKIPSIVGSSIKVNRVIEIPSAPLQLPRVRKTSKCAGTSATDVNQNDHDELVNIPVPSSHLGPGIPITVRLLSYKRREGMVGEGSRYSGWRKLPPPSRSILFHCHGGGFVAQSSKSHELYLRDWAVALDVPILSVDYSLAPEAPFPRALEEVFYAYCWMLKNCEHLGTTAEHIVVAGDSAGANLSIGVALKCIEMGIRIPDGIFLAYCPTLIGFVPSPARLLCLMDPLLPFGFMMRCLRAYAAPGSETLEENAKHVEEAANVRNASRSPQFTLHIENEVGGFSASSSRRTSAAKSPLSSVAENSKWDQMQHCQNSKGAMIADEDVSEESSNTYASASYHSQTVERTDLPSTEDDNSSCVSFEDDSQPIVHFPIEMTTNITKHTESEEYIDRFLNKYVVDNADECEKLDINECAAISKDLNPTFPKTISEENLFIETGKELITFDSLHDRFNHAFNSITNTFNRYTESYEIRSTENDRTHHHYIKDLRNMDALIARSPTSEFGFLIPRDPFLSPYFASDEWLKQLPQTKILSLDMDPCLDDCVMFAKKLKLLGTPITLDILKGLPHGFLNFTMLSNEAMEGSKRCIKLLQELLYVPPKAETL